MNAKSFREGNKANLDELIRISRRYGSDPEFILAGGGNTSWKNDEIMFVKASGTTLGNISDVGFVCVDLKRLEKIWFTAYSDDPAKREEEVLRDLLACRMPEDPAMRPSVETLLHGFFPYIWVVHLHPALVNGMTCAQMGKDFFEDAFGNEALWIPVTDPGYILAKRVRDAALDFRKSGKPFPQIVFLQNHGVFVAANTSDDIERIYARIFSIIDGHVSRKPRGDIRECDSADADEVRRAFAGYLDHPAVLGFSGRDLDRYLRDREAFTPLSLAFTPDHIVYYGYRPLWVDTLDDLPGALHRSREEDSFLPKIVALKGTGVFAVAGDPKAAETARDLFLDDVKIAVYTESFGGYRFMPEENIDFIRHWEAEKYRASMNLGGEKG